MSIIKRSIIRPKTKIVYEVWCRYGDKYLVSREVFDTYREASKYVRNRLAKEKGIRRYEVREVSRLDVFYSIGQDVSMPRRVIEDVIRRDWDMKIRPAKKKGGIMI
jgi:hypothetical protein